MSSNSEPQDKPAGLSSAKREDIWALIIAAVVMVIAMVTPEGVYNVFKKLLYIF